jgi:inorganic pyrophosphatase
MQDEAGIDDKIICVPLADPNWNAHDEVEELPELLRSEIEQFFSIYKDIEHKRVVVDGWCSRQDALDEIAAARERFREMDDRPTRPAIGGRIPGHQRNQ